MLPVVFETDLTTVVCVFAGGALATVRDAVNCCVATLPEVVVEGAEVVVVVGEILLAEFVVLVVTTVAATVLACTAVSGFGPDSISVAGLV